MSAVLRAVAVVDLALWVYLVLGHGRFWRNQPRLPAVPSPATGWPSVTVVVPARDEAGLLPHTLPALIGQRYPGRFDVVVVDDESADDTEIIAVRAGAEVVSGQPPPPEWAGKVWAMAQGVAAAGTADPPRYLLFTDADIAHPPDSLTRLVALAEAEDRDLVSVMARLNCESLAERLLVPAFVYFFAQLYPFRRVAARRWRTAAAAGGCLLVRWAALERAGGLAAVSDALIDDVAVGRLVKRSGGRLWLGYCPEVRSVRRYPRLGDIWRMVTRSAWIQLRRSWLLLLATLVALTLVYVMPVLCLIAGDEWTRLAGGVALLLAMATYLPTLHAYQRSPNWCLTLPLIAVSYAVMTIDSALRGGEWKGRTNRLSPSSATIDGR